MAREKAAWTVMVYLAGDNNLTDASVFAMTELKRVTPGGNVNIITQFDPMDDYLPTHRYQIGKNDTPDRIRPLSDDIIDTSETTGFRRESAFARGHDRVRRDARERGRQASVAEAGRLAAEEGLRVAAELAQLRGGAPPIALQSAELNTLFIEPEKRTIRPNETDTGSPITLYNFMSLCVQEFPADHFMVVLSGHGAGLATDFLLRDDSPAGSLTIGELQGAFKQLSVELGNQPIDILGLDTCLMSMAEVAYELRGLVKVMVSSESYSPVSGWPYRQIISNLKDLVEQSLIDTTLQDGLEQRLATNIVEEYVNFYADYALGGLSVDQAALNVGEADTLRDRVDRFANAMTEELEKDQPEFVDKIVMAHWEAQSYNGELFVDLIDFCDCLLKRQTTGTVFETGLELKSFLEEQFVLKSCYSGPVYQYSHGVSIYFPWSRVDDEYRNLDFIDSRARSGWGKFLKVYTNLTRRAPRDTSSTNAFFRKNREVDTRQYRNTQGRGPEGQNRITSMRNPPVYAEPEACIRERDNLREGLMSLLGL
jgi:hypothetical protein